ncbi:MAG: GntR family transcriptional regulator [Synergistaceae bacterium]|jgi:DNA-binding GntR family transcriptional regulator|nr:GntR family transcriptional regulator [Synergistaceae bacterium]
MTEKKENSSNEVLRHVVEMVVSGKVLPTEVLYETTMADYTGLSRTPVREALLRLVNEGFLGQVKGKRGYVVPPLTLEDMRNVYHARECTESKLAYLAAEKAIKSDVEALKQINEEESRAKSNFIVASLYTRRGESYSAVDVNVKFHMSVAHIADNKYLKRIYEMVYWRSHLYTHYIISRLRMPPEVEEIFERRRLENIGAKEHAELTDAIAIRDGERAAALTLNHLRNTTYFTIAFRYPERLDFSAPIV